MKTDSPEEYSLQKVQYIFIMQKQSIPVKFSLQLIVTQVILTASNWSDYEWWMARVLIEITVRMRCKWKWSLQGVSGPRHTMAINKYKAQIADTIPTYIICMYIVPSATLHYCLLRDILPATLCVRFSLLSTIIVAITYHLIRICL